MAVLREVCRIVLPKRRYVIEYPERAPMRADNDVISVDCDFAPWSQARSRPVGPRSAAVSSHVNQTVIGPGPQNAGIKERRRQRVNDPAMLALFRVQSFEDAKVRRWRTGFPAEVRAYHL